MPRIKTTRYNPNDGAPSGVRGRITMDHVGHHSPPLTAVIVELPPDVSYYDQLSREPQVGDIFFVNQVIDRGISLFLGGHRVFSCVGTLAYDQEEFILYNYRLELI